MISTSIKSDVCEKDIKGQKKKSFRLSNLTHFEYIKLDRDKSTFKSHRDFSSEKEITFKHL